MANMKNIHFVKTVFVIVVFSSAVLQVSGATFSEYPVAVGTGNQQNPEIDGTGVVYEDNSSGTWDIKLADVNDISSPIIKVVAGGSFNQRKPAIYQNIVVWEDDSEGDWDIWAGDILNPSGVIRNDQILPAVSGNIVVWQDSRNGSADIYAAVLSGSASSKCVVKPAGDFNGDCKVDYSDLAIIGGSWLDNNIVIDSP
jgi:beta propeller repeat protein